MASTLPTSKRQGWLPQDPMAHPSQRSALASSMKAAQYTHLDHTTALSAHHGCVNALAFSRDGRWLASGGDDQEVRVWDVGGKVGRSLQPSGIYAGAQSNIFSISFTSDGNKIVSGGLDTNIYVHNLASEGTLSDNTVAETVYTEHTSSVRSVCCHPEDPHLFLSASEDGTVRRYDARMSVSTGVIHDQGEFNDVVYHPRTSNLFVTANENGSVWMYDARMAFEGHQNLASEVVVRKYETRLVRPTSSDPKGNKHATPDPCSVTFDPTGTLLAVTNSRYIPTLYETSDERILATLSCPPATEGAKERYSNSCTIKNGSFGGTEEQLYFAAGSDDFGVYVWSIPPIPTLRSLRKTLSSSSPADWKLPDGSHATGHTILPPTQISQSTFSFSHAGMRFAQFKAAIPSPPPNTEITIPTSLSTPSSILRTHRSIPNSTLFHPHLPLLFSCGIEKVIHVHSATPLDSEPRMVFRKRGSTPVEDVPRGGTEEERARREDRETLEHFDMLLRREGDMDVFGDEEEDDDEGSESSETSDDSQNEQDYETHTALDGEAGDSTEGEGESEGDS